MNAFPSRRTVARLLAGSVLAGLVVVPALAQQPLSITPIPGKPAPRAPAPVPPPPGAPQPGAPTPSLDQIGAFLSGLTQLTGNFTQIGPDGRRTEGKFYMRRPGRLRFEYDPPSPLEIVADGSSVVLRDRKLATQDLYAIGQTPLKFLVAERVDLRRDVSVKSVRLDGDNLTVVIEDRSTFGGTSRIALGFDAKLTTLRRWVVTDPQGYDTTVMLSHLDTTHRPDDKLFVIDYQRKL